MSAEDETESILISGKTKSPKAQGKTETSPEAETESILISFKLPSHELLTLRVKKESSMEKIFDVVAMKLGVHKKSVTFLFDGQIVNRTYSPKMLMMKEDDQIDCMLQQTGGKTPY